MNKEQFKKKYELLEKEINIYYGEREQNGKKIIRDGIVDIDAYLNSRKKIMWVLKEPYDIDKKGTVGTGGYSLVGNLKEKRSIGENKTSPATFLPIIYTSYAILNGIEDFKQLSKNIVYKEYCKSLKNISYINIQKFPAKKNSNDITIKEAFEKNKDIILKQISVINPDIIISCLWGAHYSFGKGIDENEYLKGKTLIKARHPAQRSIKRFEYVNEILKHVD